MNKTPVPVSLSIMGKDYKIACPPEEQNDLLQSARQLDIQMRQMRDSGKVAGADRIAVMAALNLAHELQLMKSQNAQLNQTLAECLAKMAHKIENVLENK
ncbi:MAG: cell division protein ZapA [Methylobacter sp.]|nr:cell division protein ZapA [Methylobacter sp.]MDP2100423.1 cell division protein ZapA [Methylobacter sp.]MDP2427663.1 cell division protein ZapA [Methylobacter sp.]MDP3054079.1 cell division protein ZapA [Methylobacter sp.]MDP3362557.1 cell division protein ZapA [Methylobacter sp.]